MQDAEDELEKGRQTEAKQRADIDTELKRADALKAERAAARSRLDHSDDDVNKVRGYAPVVPYLKLVNTA